jgi:hypothetical protein
MADGWDVAEPVLFLPPITTNELGGADSLSPDGWGPRRINGELSRVAAPRVRASSLAELPLRAVQGATGVAGVDVVMELEAGRNVAPDWPAEIRDFSSGRGR